MRRKANGFDRAWTLFGYGNWLTPSWIILTFRNVDDSPWLASSNSLDELHSCRFVHRTHPLPPCFLFLSQLLVTQQQSSTTILWIDLPIHTLNDSSTPLPLPIPSSPSPRVVFPMPLECKWLAGDVCYCEGCFEKKVYLQKFDILLKFSMEWGLMVLFKTF